MTEPTSERALIAKLGSPEKSERLIAAEALAAIGTRRALPELDRVALYDPSRDWRSGYSVADSALNAAIAIRGRGDYSRDDLRRLLRAAAEPGEPGAFATRALGRLPGDWTRDARRALRSREARVRANIVRALGEGRQTRARRLLSGLLRRDPDRAVRLAAAEALGKIGGAEAAGALIDALGDPYERVRQEAATRLGYLRVADPKIIDALERSAQDDPHDLTRSWASASLELLARAGD